MRQRIHGGDSLMTGTTAAVRAAMVQLTLVLGVQLVHMIHAREHEAVDGACPSTTILDVNCDLLAATTTGLDDGNTPSVQTHMHLQDMLAMLIAVCTVFCTLLALVILKKPVPRLHDAIPREPLCWSHSDNLFVFTDLASDSIMIKNAGLIDIDLSGCKIRVEHSQDRGIYYNFSFPEGYLLVAGTTVSICYRLAAKSVYVPRRRVDRLDSRTSPRLRWASYNDGPVDSSLDSAALFDERGYQIACESAVLQQAISSGIGPSYSSDTSLATVAFDAYSPRTPTTPDEASWY